MDIRPLTLTDRLAWSHLLAVSFARQPAQMEQLLQHFYGERQLVAWGAWDGDNLAAQYSCLLTKLWLPNCAELQTVGMSINMAVHPNYRGRGLIKQVSWPVYDEVRERGGIAGVGFSNAEGVKVDKRSKGYGYRVVGKMVSVLALISKRRWKKRPFSPSIELTTTWPASLINVPHSSDKIHFVTTPATLQQRFGTHPFRAYQFGVQHGANDVEGVVVYRPFTRWGVSGVSLLTAYGADLPQLVSGWLQVLSNNGLYFVHMATSPNATLYQILKQQSRCFPIYRTRTPYFLTAKPLLNDTFTTLFDFDQWDCLGGDIL